MHVLIESGTRNCGNMGDVAMLQVAVQRLAALWPGASVSAFTDDAAALARHCPRALPVLETGRDAWFAADGVLGRGARRLPWPVQRHRASGERRARARWPDAYRWVMALKLSLKGRDAAVVDAFLRAVRQSDVLVCCGQATLTDEAFEQAMRLLDTADLALAAGVPVVMLGQGLGPLTNPELLARARGVIPRVALLALRERLEAPALAAALGVPFERVVVTGDEAIEMAHAARPPMLGAGLGVHLRVAPLAIPDVSALAPLASVLQDAARRRGATMVPLPISRHQRGTNDMDAIRVVVKGFAEEREGGDALDTPAAVIRAAGQCRVVVSGAYHAAVFALAQGIPVVCLARSRYYTTKFAGLCDLFGAGCQVVQLAEPDLPARLATAIDGAWTAADSLRPSLLAVAVGQVAAGREVYARLGRLVGRSDRSREAAASAAPAARPVGAGHCAGGTP
jgi:polysaccharide pyruvyl transferase WcaK-like protein